MYYSILTGRERRRLCISGRKDMRPATEESVCSGSMRRFVRKLGTEVQEQIMEDLKDQDEAFEFPPPCHKDTLVDISLLIKPLKKS